eukprot:jgi/Pico_ML_1/55600/g1266.t1
MAEVRASQVAQWRAHEGACLGACFSHDGAYVLTGGQDRVVRLWTAREGSASPKALQTFVGHGRSVRGVACSVDGDRVASCSAAGEARVWDVRTARSLRVLRGHVAAAHAVSFVGVDDAMAVTGSEDASVMLWDLRASSHKPVQTMREASDSVTCVFGWKDGVVAAGADGCVRTYDVRRGKCVADACGAPVSCVSFAEDGVRAVAACLDHRMTMYDRSDGMHLATFRGHRSESVRTGCAFVAGDRHVACGSEDGRVCVWDAMPACRTGAGGGSNRHVVDRTADMDGDEARRRAAKQAKAGVRAADKLGAVLLVAAAAAAWMYARGGDERRAQGSDKQADEALHHKETSP